MACVQSKVTDRGTPALAVPSRGFELAAAWASSCDSWNQKYPWLSLDVSDQRIAESLKHLDPDHHGIDRTILSPHREVLYSEGLTVQILTAVVALTADPSCAHLRPAPSTLVTALAKATSREEAGLLSALLVEAATHLSPEDQTQLRHLLPTLNLGDVARAALAKTLCI